MRPIVEVLSWVVGTALCVFVFFALIGLCINYRYRKIIPNSYEWLFILSHYEWKFALDVRNEMQKLKNTSAQLSPFMYYDLGILEGEGFIESRRAFRKLHGFTFVSREYRLKPTGTRKKINLDQKKKETLDIHGLQPL